MGCLVVLLRILKGMFFVVLLSMLKGMFGCITEYAQMDVGCITEYA